MGADERDHAAAAAAGETGAAPSDGVVAASAAALGDTDADAVAAGKTGAEVGAAGNAVPADAAPAGAGAERDALRAAVAAANTAAMGAPDGDAVQGSAGRVCGLRAEGARGEGAAHVSRGRGIAWAARVAQVERRAQGEPAERGGPPSSPFRTAGEGVSLAGSPLLAKKTEKCDRFER